MGRMSEGAVLLIIGLEDCSGCEFAFDNVDRGRFAAQGVEVRHLRLQEGNPLHMSVMRRQRINVVPQFRLFAGGRLVGICEGAQPDRDAEALMAFLQGWILPLTGVVKQPKEAKM